MKPDKQYDKLLMKITDIIFNKMNKYPIDQDMYELIVEEMQDLWRSIFKNNWDGKIHKQITSERHALLIEKEIYDTVEYFVRFPQNTYKDDIIFIYIDIYNEIYTFVKNWALSREEYEFLFNLKQMQSELKNKIGSLHE